MSVNAMSGLICLSKINDFACEVRNRWTRRLTFGINSLRYASANALILAGVILTLRGGGWTWSGYLLSLFLVGLFDAPHILVRPIAGIANLMLYATLPLLVLFSGCVFYVSGASSPESIADMFELSRGDNFLALSSNKLICDLGAFTSLGTYYGMIGGTVAHELVHRVSSKLAPAIGCLLLSPIWETGVRIEHVYVHHKFVATDFDTATARRGESFYSFFLRATVSQFLGAYEFEKNRLQKRQGSLFYNRFYIGQLMSVAYFIILIYFYGLIYGAAICVYVAAVGKVFLRLTDYISHYGLVRIKGEPISCRHSWDCYYRMSNYVLYNLTLHSAHHLSASTPFWDLEERKNEAPRLPWGIISAGLIALVPPLWHRRMRQHLSDWDVRLASEKEKAYLKAAGLYIG